MDLPDGLTAAPTDGRTVVPTDAPGAPPNPIPDRVRLVIALTEVNSRHLRSEARRGGAEIELERALEDERLQGPTPVLLARIAEMQSRMSAADAEARRIEAERDWLEQALTHFDDPVPVAGAAVSASHQ